MSLPNLVFQALQRSGDNYIASYKPPSSGGTFATLTITLIQEESRNSIATLVEEETRHWLSRYPVPVFSSACNLQDDLIDLSDVRGSKHLLALPPAESPTFLWSRGQSEQMPAVDDSELLRIYNEFPHTTLEHRIARANESAKFAKLGWFVVFFWSVIGPLAFLIAESQSELLGTAVLIYSLYRLTRKALELTGRWPKSKRARVKAEKEARARHYIYHCEMNPDGFNRLKFENLDRMAAKDNLADKAKLDG